MVTANKKSIIRINTKKKKKSKPNTKDNHQIRRDENKRGKEEKNPTNPKQLAKWQSVQFSSVAQLCPILCDPMNRSTPGLPLHHHLPEFTQTHVHRVRDAIQPSHLLSSPSPPASNPSQHQSLFQ